LIVDAERPNIPRIVDKGADKVNFIGLAGVNAEEPLRIEGEVARDDK
jgi:hypothetical protein